MISITVSKKKHWNQFFLFILSAFTILFLSSCYHFDRPLPPSSKSNIFIDEFRNQTEQEAVENIMTFLLTRQLLRDGLFHPVNRKEDAEFILSGEVIGYRIRPTSFDDSNQPVQFEETMEAAFHLQKKSSWKKDFRLSSSTSFTTLRGAEETERSAQERIADRIARNALRRLRDAVRK